MTLRAIVCRACRRAWVVEARHATASCPACRAPNDLATRTPIWEGNDARDAAPALLQHNAGPAGALAVAQAQARPNRAAALPHASRTMAAASQATGIVNRSEKAEAIARALCASGPATQEALLQAMAEAGLAEARAEAEVVRMLATDILMEPRPGRYVMVP